MNLSIIQPVSLPESNVMPPTLERPFTGEFASTPGQVAERFKSITGAARWAKAQQAAGNYVIVRGPEIPTRHYRPELAGRGPNGRWSYDIPCSRKGCPNFMYPTGVEPDDVRTCRTCWKEHLPENEEHLRALEQNRQNSPVGHPKPKDAPAVAQWVEYEDAEP